MFAVIVAHVFACYCALKCCELCRFEWTMRICPWHIWQLPLKVRHGPTQILYRLWSFKACGDLGIAVLAWVTVRGERSSLLGLTGTYLLLNVVKMTNAINCCSGLN